MRTMTIQTKGKTAMDFTAQYVAAIKRADIARKRREDAEIRKLGRPHAVFTQTYEDEADEQFGVWVCDDDTFLVLKKHFKTGKYLHDSYKHYTKELLEGLVIADNRRSRRKIVQSVTERRLRDQLAHVGWVLSQLISLYVKNQGTRSEFLACVTAGYRREKISQAKKYFAAWDEAIKTMRRIKRMAD